jgi:small subunit ribosomal protein S3
MIPLTTLRADIDYALELAHTPLGIIGCKVWINRGEIFGKGLNGQVVPPKYVPFERNNRFGNNRDNKPNNNTTKGAH